MIRFVVRDFVQGWYDRISLAHPNFPISAEPTSPMSPPAYIFVHGNSRAKHRC